MPINAEFSPVTLVISKKLENSQGWSARFWAVFWLSSHPSKPCDAGVENAHSISALPPGACTGSANRRYQRGRVRRKEGKETSSALSASCSGPHHPSNCFHLGLQCFTIAAAKSSLWVFPNTLPTLKSQSDLSLLSEAASITSEVWSGSLGSLL